MPGTKGGGGAGTLGTPPQGHGGGGGAQPRPGGEKRPKHCYLGLTVEELLLNAILGLKTSFWKLEASIYRFLMDCNFSSFKITVSGQNACFGAENAHSAGKKN